MYYIYLPGAGYEGREEVTLYQTEEEAERARKRFEAAGWEAHICDFGYPFA